MKICEIIKKKPVNGDVGIEIETEGRRLWNPAEAFYWRGEIDGSLRGENLEYIFKKPFPIEDVPKAMQELNKGFKDADSKLDYSFRTSVHVHVNVSSLEYDATLAYMYAYLLLERVLVRYCGDDRIGNRFCLRFEDAEGLSEAFNHMIEHGPQGLLNIPNDKYRYAAMNIDALKKYGSLEFRSMRGTNDEAVVSNWAQALVNLRDYAEALGNPKEVFEAISHLGPYKFAQQALGSVFDVFAYENFENDIRFSMSITFDFPFNWSNRFVEQKPEKKAAPKKLWFDMEPMRVQLNQQYEVDFEPDEVR